MSLNIKKKTFIRICC